MAHRAEVAVHALDQRLSTVPELAADAVRTHRRPAVERLQPGGAVGVAEHLTPNLTGFPSRALGELVERSVEVRYHLLPCPGARREQQPRRRMVAPEHVRPQDLLELGPERHD